MRYQQVVDRFTKLVAARDECSREWLVGRMVMCVEFDIFAAAEASIALPQHTEKHRAERGGGRLVRLVRVTFFGPDKVNHAFGRVDTHGMTPVEQSEVTEWNRVVDAWVEGRIDRLPPSTTSLVADHFRFR